MKLNLTSLVLASLALAASTAEAQTMARPSVEQLERVMVTREPQTRVDRLDHERLTVRRLDVIDENGVIRMTLSADLPDPIVDGIQYRRIHPAAGLTLYNERGDERGGLAILEAPEGGVAALALDHATGDAIGWRVSPDGAVRFIVNQAPAEIREPALGGAAIPGVHSPTRLRLSVAPDGTPSVELADGADQARIRLGLSPEGYGVLEFIDADGGIVGSFSPERDGSDAPRSERRRKP